MKRTSGVLLGLLFVLALAACSGGGSSSTTPHIYVSGGAGSGGPPYAIYWKDGKLNQVDGASGYWGGYIQVAGGHIYVAGGDTTGKIVSWVDGTRTLGDIGTYSSAGLQGTALSGGSLYVSGQVNDVPKPRLAYWLNGALNVLAMNGTDNNSYSDVNNIVSCGGSVYIVGSTNFYVVATDKYVGGTPTYWKAGSTSPNPFPLPAGYDGGEAKSAAVSGSDWYAVGDCWGSSVPTAPVIWKNGGTGTALAMPGGYGSGVARTISFSGSNTYVSGVVSTDGTTSAAAVWINGTPTVLPLPAGVTGNACATNAVAVGNTVYVAGTIVPDFWDTWNDRGVPMLWTVNGSTVTAVALAFGTTYPQAKITGVGVSGSDVWIAATVGTLKTTDSSFQGSTPQQAGYWKNGAWSFFDMGSWTGSGTGGLCVVNE